jgi:hypothetical protein
MDSVWDPASDGDVWLLLGEVEGQRFEAWLGWADGGWTRVVGIGVGEAVTSLRLRPERGVTRYRTGLPPVDGVPGGVVGRIADAVERERAELDVTQRAAMVFRDVASGALEAGAAPAVLGGRPFEVMRDGGPLDQVAIASGLYRVFSDLGRRSPTEDVAEALGLSRATAGRRIAEARARGILPPARPGIGGVRS